MKANVAQSFIADDNFSNKVSADVQRECMLYLYYTNCRILIEIQCNVYN